MEMFLSNINMHKRRHSLANSGGALLVGKETTTLDSVLLLVSLDASNFSFLELATILGGAWTRLGGGASRFEGKGHTGGRAAH